MLLVCPESHFHLTMATSMSCLGGPLCALLRSTLCLWPLSSHLLPWLLHVKDWGFCCQSAHGHWLLPHGESCPFCF